MWEASGLQTRLSEEVILHEIQEKTKVGCRKRGKLSGRRHKHTEVHSAGEDHPHMQAHGKHRKGHCTGKLAFTSMMPFQVDNLYAYNKFHASDITAQITTKTQHTFKRANYPQQ